MVDAGVSEREDETVVESTDSREQSTGGSSFSESEAEHVLLIIKVGADGSSLSVSDSPGESILR